MNYKCYYCESILYSHRYEYNHSRVGFKCVNCFKTNLSFVNNKLKLAILTGNEFQNYICLYFSNNEIGCSVVVKPNGNPIYTSDNEFTYEDCISFFKKFDSVKAFL